MIQCCQPCLERNGTKKEARHILEGELMCDACFRGEDGPDLPRLTRHEYRDLMRLRKRVMEQAEQLRDLKESVCQLQYKRPYVKAVGDLTELEPVKQLTARHFGAERLRMHGNRPHEVAARSVAYKLCRDMGYSLTEIAQAFSCHHTTVIYALRKIERDPELQRTVDELFVQIPKHASAMAAD